MNTHVWFERTFLYRKFRIYALAFFWFLGLLAGMGLAISNDNVSSAIFNEALFGSTLPTFVVFSVGLPVAISAIALWYPLYTLNYPLFLLQGVCRGFCGMVAFLALGSGAWLIRAPFLFSGSCVSVLMWWLSLRHSYCKGNDLPKDILFVSVLSCSIVLIDIFLISNLLTSVTKYI